MKDLKYDCYKRDRLSGISSAALAKIYVNHEAMEKLFIRLKNCRLTK